MPLNGVIEIYPKPTVVAMVTKISEYYLNINFDININLSITISIKIHSCITLILISRLISTNIIL